MNKKFKWTLYGVVGVYVAISVVFTTMTIDGSQSKLPFVESEAKQHLQATSTYEFDLSGIENHEKLKERIKVMIAETKAKQQKQDAEERLQELEKKQTALE